MIVRAACWSACIREPEKRFLVDRIEHRRSLACLERRARKRAPPTIGFGINARRLAAPDTCPDSREIQCRHQMDGD